MAKKNKTDSMQAALQFALKLAATNKAVVNSEADVLLGLRIPLAFELFLNCNVLPLGVAIEVLGEEGSNKTTFAYWLASLFTQLMGVGHLYLTEGKVSPKLIQSIIGYDDELKAEGKHALIFRYESQDMTDWTKVSSTDVKKWLGHFETHACKTPVIFIVDSIMGQNVKETNDKVADSGTTGRGFAIEAGALTTYVRTMAGHISKGPFLFVMINHAKPEPKVTDWAPQTYRSPGGKQVKFQSTYRIMMEKVTAKKGTVTDKDSVALKSRSQVLSLKIQKSSLGEDTMRLRVPFLWQYAKSPVNGSVRQYSRLDWDTALALLLYEEVHAAGDKKGLSAEECRMAIDKLDSIVHFRSATKVPPRFVSNTFGRTADNPMTAAELGAAIQADDVLVNKIRDLFGVQRYTVWDAQTDYAVLIKKMRQGALDQLVSFKES